MDMAARGAAEPRVRLYECRQRYAGMLLQILPNARPVNPSLDADRRKFARWPDPGPQQD